MLPFVMRSDMFEAIKKANANVSDVDVLLISLLTEHNVVGALAQLKNLSVNTPVRGKGGGSRLNSVEHCGNNWAPTPPESLHADCRLMHDMPSIPKEAEGA
jgi:hypothetical protein